MSNITGAWKVSPTDTDLVGNGDEAISDTRSTLCDRIVKEHFLDTLETSPQPQQGRHRPGSAVSYAQSAAPTLKPDGSAVLDAIDHGRLWIDTDTGVMYFWKWDSGTSSGAWTECAPAHGLVLLTSGTSWTATHTGPVKVTCVGGGGGGNYYVSGIAFGQRRGGGAGAQCSAIVDVVAGTSYTIAIGAAGVTAGADGGDTTFDTGLVVLTAGGGQGATTISTELGGFGGVAENGTLNLRGEDGHGSAWTTTDAGLYTSGKGGSTPYGNGASHQVGYANGYGAGGVGVNASYVSGTAGCIIIEW